MKVNDSAIFKSVSQQWKQGGVSWADTRVLQLSGWFRKKKEGKERSSEGQCSRVTVTEGHWEEWPLRSPHFPVLLQVLCILRSCDILNWSNGFQTDVQRLIAASSWPAWQSSHHIWIYECGSYMPLQTCYGALRCTTCIQWWYMASRTCVCVCETPVVCARNEHLPCSFDSLFPMSP